jgi:hypothetical protein
MTSIEPRAEPLTDGAVLQIQWGPIVAGGIAAAALALVLHNFAVAIGLSVSSPAPTWRGQEQVKACPMVLAHISPGGCGRDSRPARQSRLSSATASTGFWSGRAPRC